MNIVKGQFLKEFLEWGPYFKVEADITVTEVPTDDWTNVFHFTTGENSGSLGSRIPAVWINKDGYLHICTNLVGKTYGICKGYDFVLDKKHHLVIGQFHENGEIIYKIEIDGDNIFSEVNKNPQAFDFVKLYASDPWHTSFATQYGYLENIFAESAPTDIPHLCPDCAINAHCETSNYTGGCMCNSDFPLGDPYIEGCKRKLS